MTPPLLSQAPCLSTPAHSPSSKFQELFQGLSFITCLSQLCAPDMESMTLPAPPCPSLPSLPLPFLSHQ